jgi:hypothetical protein
MWELDQKRRELLVLKRMINNMETAISDAIEVSRQMEEVLFDEWERQNMKVQR